ncbi:HNH endonuclease signature motif containing protein [Nocardioides aquaticus]
MTTTHDTHTEAADLGCEGPWEPAPAPVRPGVRVTGALLDARGAVSAAAGVSTTALSNADLTTAAHEITALESQVAAYKLAVLAEARDRGQHGPVGDEADPDPAAWLAKLTGDPTEVLRGGLWIARLLQTKYHHTRRALEAGTLRLSQAKVLVRAAERAPKALTAEQITAAEESLVLTATGESSPTNTKGRPMTAARLRDEARRVFANMLPAKEEADAAEGDDLAAEEDDAARECYLSLNDRGDGTFRGTFVIPTLHGRILQAALERLTAPRRHTKDSTGAPITDEPAQHGTSYGEKIGAGFCELIEHLPTQGFDHGNTIGLLITAALDQMAAGLGTGTLATGEAISIRSIRRLACNAGHLPVVLGGESMPVDVGKSRRRFTRHQSHALAVLHDTCGIAGCERPFAWCELHHLTEWSKGGPTDLANALPLCGHHHRKAHDPAYEMRRHRGREYVLKKIRR